MSELQCKVAAVFAEAAHEGQTYSNNRPYFTHLKDTYAIACIYELSEQVKVATFLHDILEDTDVTYQELVDMFGQEVADLVEAVTDKPGKDRAERHRKTYPLLRKAGPEAVSLKLADRAANMINSIDTDYKDLYQSEYPIFKKYLYVPGEFDKLWELLDILAEA
jgi:(p)ppGpp synthase/HD superfamily hydrolase